MVRLYTKLMITAVSATALVMLISMPSQALKLIAPTEGQAVRENVKIQIPEDAVPDKGFLAVMVAETDAPEFVVALDRDLAKDTKGVLTFYWNSKSPYYRSDHPMDTNYFKDGSHVVTVQVHDASGKCMDSATVTITLKNKVARTNPAPAILLANQLPFGQVNTYSVHADVEMFDALKLPILGGLTTTSDFKLVQSVEDVRSGGEYLLRYRLGENASVNYRGSRQVLYQGQMLRPQLYRLVSKFGNVITANMFSKQAKYSIMDLLPVLPKHSVNEGDSWQDDFTLKVEGMTGPIRFHGTSKLDSIEWEESHQCAKIVSDLKGMGQVSLVGGKVTSAGEMDAHVTTFFAYQSGRMLKREIILECPAIIMQGAGTDNGSAPSAPERAAPSPYDDSWVDAAASPDGSGYPAPKPTPGLSAPAEKTSTRGTIRINVVIGLES